MRRQRLRPAVSVEPLFKNHVRGWPHPEAWRVSVFVSAGEVSRNMKLNHVGKVSLAR